MAKAEKLPSGKWRCVAYLGKDLEGKRIRKSFIADKKKDAEELARKCELKEKNLSRSKMKSVELTVCDAVDMYIRNKAKKVSPPTLTGYMSYRQNLLNDILDIRVLSLNEDILNDWIERIAENHSAKTVKNAWSLVRSSLMEVLPRSVVIDWRIELPSMSKKRVNVPTEADIQALLQYLKKNDKDLYIACLLAAFGTMRRSEIAALTVDDVDGNIISINKAVVRDNQGNWVLKGTKTEMSERDVIMPDFVIKALPKKGNLVNLTPSNISSRFIKTLIRLDMRTFRFHDLRHYSASIMHVLGASNEIIMHRGGWSNEQTLCSHYRGNMSEYDLAFTEKLNQHFQDKFVV